MVSIGMSHQTNSFDAGKDAARRAADASAKAGWALTFAGGRHEPCELLRGLRSVFGSIPVYGGSAVGTITSASLGYEGYECAAAVFDQTMPAPKSMSFYGLEHGEASVGKQIGRKLEQEASEQNTVLMFYDSIASSPPPTLYVGSRLLDGIYSSISMNNGTIIGAGLVGDLQMSRSFLFDGAEAVKHAATAIILPNELISQTTIMHGCSPVSSFLEITSIDGPEVFELDGRPALEVLLEMTGLAADEAIHGDLSFIVTLGEWHGEAGSELEESAYVNRLILRCNPDKGSITLFESDFHEGSLVQIMSRDNQTMLDSVVKQTREQLSRSAGRDIALALYIDCAGRTCAFSGAEVEEASLLQRELGSAIPLLGFYSGVEIAPLFGRSRPLDWTGVLTFFTRGPGHA